MSGTFLDRDELAELTGIRGGKPGQTREQRQAAALRQMKIPHYVNAAGKPVVARATVEGTATKQPEPLAWEPRLAA